MHQSRTTLLCTIIALTVSASLHAQTVDPLGRSESSEQAKEAFNRGNALFEQKDYDGAARAFRDALQLMPSWKLYYNIAQAEAAARRYGQALENFEKYVAEGGDDVPEARLEEVLREMQRLRMIVGSIRIYGGPPDAVVREDGQPRGKLPMATELRVSAGAPHLIEIVHGDRTIHSQSVTVGSGSTAEIRLTDEPLEGPPAAGETEDNTVKTEEEKPADPVTAPPAEPKKKPLLISGITVGAVGIAAGGVALGFLLASNAKYDEFGTMNEEIQAGERSPDDGEVADLKSAVQTYDNVAIAMAITSGVMIATSAVLIALHVSGKKKSESPTAGAGGLIVRF